MFILECTTGYREIIRDSDYCYKIAHVKRNWEDAKESCSNDNGNLACFHINDEISTLSNKCKECWVGYSWNLNKGNFISWCYSNTIL